MIFSEMKDMEFNKNYQVDNFYRSVVAFLVSFVVTCSFMFLYLGPLKIFIKTNITSSTLVLYISTIFVFLIITCLCLRYLRPIDIVKMKSKFNTKQSIAVSYAFIIGIALLLWKCYVTSMSAYEYSIFAKFPDELILFHENHKVYAIFLFAIILQFFASPLSIKFLFEKVRSFHCFVLSISLLGIVFSYSLYQPDVFTNWFNYYHSHAYFHSVYNVFCGFPYTDENQSMYGHYALFIVPLAKAFNCSFKEVIILLCVISFISYCCIAYTLCRLIGCNLLSYLGCIIIIIPFVSIYFWSYFQGWPHRLIWTSILLLYLSKLNWKHLTLSSYFWGWSIVVLSIIWNLETGIVCLMSWFAFLVIGNLLTKMPLLLRLRIILRDSISGVIAFLFAWWGTSLANVLFLKGEHIPLLDFVFPIGASTDILSFLSPKLFLPGIRLWMIIMFLSFIIINYCISQTIINRYFYEDSIKEHLPIIFTIAIMVLLQLCYFINGPSQGNLYISFPFSVILLCFIMVLLFNRYQSESLLVIKHFLLGAEILAFLSLISFILIGVTNFGICERYRNTNNRNLREYVKVKQEIMIQIPPNTKQLSFLADAIYWDLKWDGSYHFIDFADMCFKPKVIDEIYDELNNNLHVPILLDTATVRFLKGTYFAEERYKVRSIEKFEKNFYQKSSYKIGNEQLLYFVPK